MSTQKMNEDEQKKLAEIMAQVIALFQKNQIRISECSGILGSVFGYLACKTEENFPFISFFNSFIRTYHANYNGEETHDLSNEMKIDPKAKP